MRADSQKTSIKLEQALADGICRLEQASTVPFNSRLVRFLLKPLNDSRPLIEIEPGWILTAKQGEGQFLTTHPGQVELYAQNNSSVEVYAVELKPAHSSPTHCDAVRIEPTHKLFNLLQAAGKSDPRASWNALQIAVMVLLEDANLKRIRTERYSAPRDTGAVVIFGEGGNVAPDCGPIDEALKLLAASGVDTAQTKLSIELEAEYAKALGDYANNPKKLQALETLGFFRRREQAYNILTQSFARHASDPAYMRSTPIRWLAGMLFNGRNDPQPVNQGVLQVFRQALQTETDAQVKQDLQRYIGQAERLQKR